MIASQHFFWQKAGFGIAIGIYARKKDPRKVGFESCAAVLTCFELTGPYQGLAITYSNIEQIYDGSIIELPVRKWLVVEEFVDEVLDRYFKARYSVSQSVVASFLRQAVQVVRGTAGSITHCCICPQGAVIETITLLVAKRNEADHKSQGNPNNCACNRNAGHLSVGKSNIPWHSRDCKSRRYGGLHTGRRL